MIRRSIPAPSVECCSGLGIGEEQTPLAIDDQQASRHCIQSRLCQRGIGPVCMRFIHEKRKLLEKV